MSNASSSFIPQFLSKNIWSIFGITALFHVLAAVVLHQSASFVVLGLVGAGVFFVTTKRLEVGLCIALFEIVIGAHGHLVTLMYHGFPLSLRIVIFLSVMAGWLYGYVKKSWSPTFVALRDVPFLALALAVIYGVVRGYFAGNTLPALIDDANAFVVLAYMLPLSSVVWTQEHRRLFLTTFFAGVLWLAIFTFALTFLFTHISQEHIWELYVLVRDTRMFEVTLLSGPAWLADSFYGGDWYFRVFSQAHIFAPLFLLILFSFVLFLKKEREAVPLAFWVWCTSLLGLFLQSLSRSFFVGFIAGSFSLFGFWLLGGRESWSVWGSVARKKIGFLLSFLAGAGLLWLLISFPFPERPNLMASPFYRGDHDETRSLAVSSRWNMLDPLVEAIRVAPTLGQGFGKELTYVSDDPRIREMTDGTGILTTYRFEWGFLDAWVKMGIFGIVAYAWIASALVGQVLHTLVTKGLWRIGSLRELWLEIGLASGVVFLYATHVFTPYLNHPIGLVFLLLVAYLLSWKRSHGEQERSRGVRVASAKFVPFSGMPLGISSSRQEQ